MMDSDSRPCPSRPPRANVLGVGVSAINLNSAWELIDAALANKYKGYICVTGVHGVMEAQEDEGFRGILNRAFLNTPDGMPTVWVGKRQGFRQMSRVYGPDLMNLVCDLSRKKGYRHFLYGGAEGIAGDLKRRLEERFPGLNIAGTFTPPFRPLEESEEQALIAQVAAAKPDVIWVGLSTPKQEKFMAEYGQRLEATLLIGVGAAFDFHAGRVRQAPKWMQRSGLEWFFRLCTEPRRLWRRYLRNNPRFIVRILGQWLGIRTYRVDEFN